MWAQRGAGSVISYNGTKGTETHTDTLWNAPMLTDSLLQWSWTTVTHPLNTHTHTHTHTQHTHTHTHTHTQHTHTHTHTYNFCLLIQRSQGGGCYLKGRDRQTQSRSLCVTAVVLLPFSATQRQNFWGNTAKETDPSEESSLFCRSVLHAVIHIAWTLFKADWYSWYQHTTLSLF